MKEKLTQGEISDAIEGLWSDYYQNQSSLTVDEIRGEIELLFDKLESKVSPSMEGEVEGTENLDKSYIRYFIERTDTNEWYYVNHQPLEKAMFESKRTNEIPQTAISEGWTIDPFIAKAFKSKEEAEIMLKNDTINQHKNICIVTEHEFVPKLSAPFEKTERLGVAENKNTYLLDICKDEVAKDLDYKDWKDLERRLSRLPSVLETAWGEVAILFASKTLVSDAVEFLRWTAKNNWVYNCANGNWDNLGKDNSPAKAKAESKLYKLFLESKQGTI